VKSIYNIRNREDKHIHNKQDSTSTITNFLQKKIRYQLEYCTVTEEQLSGHKYSSSSALQLQFPRPIRIVFDW